MPNQLKGKVVCFTGSLSRVRRVARSELERVGGIFASAVTSRVDIVVAGDDTGGKIDKARRLKIEIWSEGDFDKALKGILPKRRKRPRSRSPSSSPVARQPKKKKQKLAAKPVCKYGANCYQTGRTHQREYSHPKKNFSDLSSSGEASSSDNEDESDSKDIELKDKHTKDGDSDASSESDVDDGSDSDRRNELTKKWKGKITKLIGADRKHIPKALSGCTKGRHVAITGWLPVERSELVALIKKCGGKVKRDVNHACHLLIVGERPGRKLFKANQLKVRLLFYPELGTMLNI